MNKELEKITNWAELSVSTQNNIGISADAGLDAIGLLLTEKYNPTEVVSLLQSLADPDFFGELYITDFFDRVLYSKVAGVAKSVAPYLSNERYSSYALKAKDNKIGLTFPLLLSYTQSKNLTAEALSNIKFNKLIDIFKKKGVFAFLFL